MGKARSCRTSIVSVSSSVKSKGLQPGSALAVAGIQGVNPWMGDLSLSLPFYQAELLTSPEAMSLFPFGPNGAKTERGAQVARPHICPTAP